jgi:hypothetical protein
MNFLASLLLFLYLGGAQAALPNECQEVSLVVTALKIGNAASAYCSSILRISTVTLTVDATATTPTVSASTLISVQTIVSGVTIVTAPAVTVPSASVS